MIHNPWIAGISALGVFALWMIGVLFLKHVNVIPSGMSRKIIHIGTGPIFLLTWLFFPDFTVSRYIAAAIPGAVTLLIFLSGVGVIKNPLLVNLMSRKNDRRELITGPFFYGIVFVLLTIFTWKSVYAILPLTILCTGDGFADILGTRYKSTLLPWSKNKTLIGSTAMFVFGTIGSLLILMFFIASTSITGNITNLVLPVFVISLASTLVESISPSNIDNLTVPAAALICTLFLFPIG